MSLPKETLKAIKVIQYHLKFSPFGELQIPTKEFLNEGISRDMVKLVFDQLFYFDIIEQCRSLKNKAGYETFQVDEQELLKLVKTQKSKKRRSVKFDKEKNRLYIGRSYIELKQSKDKLDFCVAFFDTSEEFKMHWTELFEKIEGKESSQDHKREKRKVYDIYNRINLDAKKKKLKKVFKWTNGIIELND